MIYKHLWHQINNKHQVRRKELNPFRYVQILTLRGIWLTSVTQNTAYARSQTQQVYANTFPIDILAELTVNSRQKPEWLWQARDIGLPRMSANTSCSILNADKIRQNWFLANSRWRVSIHSAHAQNLCACADEKRLYRQIHLRKPSKLWNNQNVNRKAQIQICGVLWLNRTEGILVFELFIRFELLSNLKLWRKASIYVFWLYL